MKTTNKNCEAPIAAAIREKTDKEFFPNTELCIDLKTLTRLPRRMVVDESLAGTLTRDSEEHFTFVQNGLLKGSQERVKRNPHVFEGTFITITRRDNGTLRPNFRELNTGAKGFSVEAYAEGVAGELIRGLKSLVEKK